MEVSGEGGACNVLRRDQDLRHNMMILRKQLVVNIHQLALTHRGSRLLCRNIRRAMRKRKFAHPHGDGARGDKNDFMPCIFQITANAAEFFHAANIEIPRGMGQG